MADPQWLAKRVHVACPGTSMQVKLRAKGVRIPQWREWVLRAVITKTLGSLSVFILYLSEKCSDSHPVSRQIELWHRVCYFRNRFHIVLSVYHISDNYEYFFSNSQELWGIYDHLLCPWHDCYGCYCFHLMLLVHYWRVGTCPRTHKGEMAKESKIWTLPNWERTMTKSFVTSQMPPYSCLHLKVSHAVTMF